MKAALMMTGLVVTLATSCAEAPTKARSSALGAAGVGAKKFTDAEYGCFETKAALALAADAAPSYQGSVKALVDAQCATCHSGKADGTAPDLSTFAGLVDEGEASLNRIKAGTMPTSGALAAAQQELFAQWVEGGMLEAGAAPATPAAAGASVLKDLCKGATPAPSSADANAAQGSGSASASSSGSGDASASGSGAASASGSGAASASGSGAASGSGSGMASASGSGAASGSASDTTPRKVTYAKDLKPLLDSQCVGCHGTGMQAPDFSAYATAKAGGVRGLVRVTAGTMPTVAAGGALSADEVALFQAWSDDGFLEKETP